MWWAFAEQRSVNLLIASVIRPTYLGYLNLVVVIFIECIHERFLDTRQGRLGQQLEHTLRVREISSTLGCAVCMLQLKLMGMFL